MTKLNIVLDGAFRCDECPRTYNRACDLANHRILKHSGLVLACPDCEFSTVTRPALMAHVKAHHTDRAEERFWAKVEKTPTCWLWTGSCNNYGYGRFSYPGGRYARAHRYSYEIHKGPIPAGLTIDHLCRNRLCVNPEHLEVCTQEENSRRGWSFYRKVRQCPFCEFKSRAPSGFASHVRHKHPAAAPDEGADA